MPNAGRLSFERWQRARALTELVRAGIDAGDIAHRVAVPLLRAAFENERGCFDGDLDIESAVAILRRGHASPNARDVLARAADHARDRLLDTALLDAVLLNPERFVPGLASLNADGRDGRADGHAHEDGRDGAGGRDTVLTDGRRGAGS